MTITKNF